MSDLVNFDYNITTVYGIGICFGSILGQSLGSLLQKRAFDSSRRRRENLASVCTAQIWWLGFIIYLLSLLAGIIALALIPLTMNSILGNLGLVLNALIAPKLLNESISRRTWICTGVICIGGLIVVFYGPRGTESTIPDLNAVLVLLLRLPVFIMIGFVFVTSVCCFFVIRYFIKNPVPFYELGKGSVIGSKMLPEDLNQRIEDDDDDIPTASIPLWTLPLSYSCALGVNDILSQIAFKIVGTLAFSEGNSSSFSSFIPYLLIAFAILLFPLEQFLFSRGLFTFPAVIIFPIMQTCRSLFALIGGGLFFNEFNELSLINAILFSSGSGLTLVGAYFLASEDSVSADQARGLAIFGGANANIVSRKLEDLSRVSTRDSKDDEHDESSLNEETIEVIEPSYQDDLRFFAAMPFGTLMRSSRKNPITGRRTLKKKNDVEMFATMQDKRHHKSRSKGSKDSIDSKNKILAVATLPRNWNANRNNISTHKSISSYDDADISDPKIQRASTVDSIDFAHSDEDDPNNIVLTDDILLEMQHDSESASNKNIKTVFSGTDKDQTKELKDDIEVGIKGYHRKNVTFPDEINLELSHDIQTSGRRSPPHPMMPPHQSSIHINPPSSFIASTREPPRITAIESIARYQDVSTEKTPSSSAETQNITSIPSRDNLDVITPSNHTASITKSSDSLSVETKKFVPPSRRRTYSTSSIPYFESPRISSRDTLDLNISDTSNSDNDNVISTLFIPERTNSQLEDPETPSRHKVEWNTPSHDTISTELKEQALSTLQRITGKHKQQRPVNNNKLSSPTTFKPSYPAIIRRFSAPTISEEDLDNLKIVPRTSLDLRKMKNGDEQLSDDDTDVDDKQAELDDCVL